MNNLRSVLVYHNSLYFVHKTLHLLTRIRQLLPALITKFMIHI